MHLANGKRPPPVLSEFGTFKDLTKSRKKSGIDDVNFQKKTEMLSIFIFLSKVISSKWKNHKVQNVRIWSRTSHKWSRFTFSKNTIFRELHDFCRQIWRQISDLFNFVFMFWRPTVGEFFHFQSSFRFNSRKIHWRSDIQSHRFSQFFIGSVQIPLGFAVSNFMKTVTNDDF